MNYENFGKTVQPGLPNIIGDIDVSIASFHDGVKEVASSGAFVNSGNTYTDAKTNANGTGSYFMLNFNASQSNSIYGNSNTVQPFSVFTYYCIKY